MIFDSIRSMRCLYLPRCCWCSAAFRWHQLGDGRGISSYPKRYWTTSENIDQNTQNNTDINIINNNNNNNNNNNQANSYFKNRHHCGIFREMRSFSTYLSLSASLVNQPILPLGETTTSWVSCITRRCKRPCSTFCWASCSSKSFLERPNLAPWRIASFSNLSSLGSRLCGLFCRT